MVGYPFTSPSDLNVLLEKNGFTPYLLKAIGGLLSEVRVDKLTKAMNLMRPEITINFITTDHHKKNYFLSYKNIVATECSVFTCKDWAVISSLSTKEDMKKRGFATLLSAYILQDLKNKGYKSASAVCVPISAAIAKKFGAQEFGQINYYYKLK